MKFHKNLKQLKKKSKTFKTHPFVKTLSLKKKDNKIALLNNREIVSVSINNFVIYTNKKVQRPMVLKQKKELQMDNFY